MPYLRQRLVYSAPATFLCDSVTLIFATIIITIIIIIIIIRKTGANEKEVLRMIWEDLHKLTTLSQATQNACYHHHNHHYHRHACTLLKFVTETQH